MSRAAQGGLRNGALGTLLIACLLLASCRPGAEIDPAARAEVAQLSFAIDKLTAAPNPDKRGALNALASTPCKLDPTCLLKRTCVEAYRAFTDSLDGTRAVRQALQAKTTDTTNSAQDQHLLSQLLSAEAKLRESRAAVDRCLEAQGALRRQHQL